MSKYVLLLSLIITILFVSCEDPKVGMDGIFAVTEDGVNLPYYKNPNQKLTVKSNPVIPIKHFELFFKSKPKNSDNPSLLIKLDDEGAELFYKVTIKSVGKRLAIVVNEKILSAPIVQVGIRGGHIGVSSITDEEIDEVLEQIKESKKE